MLTLRRHLLRAAAVTSLIAVVSMYFECKQAAVSQSGHHLLFFDATSDAEGGLPTAQHMPSSSGGGGRRRAALEDPFPVLKDGKVGGDASFLRLAQPRSEVAPANSGRFPPGMPFLEALATCTTLACVRAAHDQPRNGVRFNFPHFIILGFQKAATTSLWG